MKIKIRNLPPYKQAPAERKEAENQDKRKQILINEAKRAIGNYRRLEGRLKLIIRFERGDCRTDSANIIGGVCDALQGVWYENDFQIKEQDYKEVDGKRNVYSVEVVEI